jgi:hypothetical protein
MLNPIQNQQTNADTTASPQALLRDDGETQLERIEGKSDPDKEADPLDSTVVIESHSSELTPRQLELLGDRLDGIDVCMMWNSDDGTRRGCDDDNFPIRIEANGATFADLMEAVEKDQTVCDERHERHRYCNLDRSASGFDQVEYLTKVRRMQAKETAIAG